MTMSAPTVPRFRHGQYGMHASETGEWVRYAAPIQPRQAPSETEEWIAEAKKTLDRLSAFLQHIGAPHAVHWRDWIDNAEKHLERQAPSDALTDEQIDDLRSRYTEKKESREDIRILVRRAILSTQGDRK